MNRTPWSYLRSVVGTVTLIMCSFTVRAQQEEPAWRVSAGGLVFGVLDVGDAVASDAIVGADGKYDASGSQAGARASVGLGKNSIACSVAIGEQKAGQETGYASGGSRKGSVTLGRSDIDLAWVRLLQSDEQGLLGLLVGMKMLSVDAEVYRFEQHAGRTAEQTFDGNVDWKMGTAGLFGSVYLSQQFPVAFLASFNILFGDVNGMTPQIDDRVTDAEITTRYVTESSAAWGINGTVGLRYVPFRHLSMEIGYRGQILNSTDGFGPPDPGLFYDGHQAMYAAADVLF